MELPEALEKITELTAELAVKNDKLKDVTDNFSRYREKTDAEKEELTTKLETTTKDFDEFKGGIEKEKGERVKTAREAKLKELSKGDEKTAALIEEAYAILNMPEGTEEEIASRLEKARAIAVPAGTEPNPNDPSGAGGGMAGDPSTNEGEMSPAAADAHARMFPTAPKK